MNGFLSGATISNNTWLTPGITFLRIYVKVEPFQVTPVELVAYLWGVMVTTTSPIWSIYTFVVSNIPMLRCTARFALCKVILHASINFGRQVIGVVFG